MSDTVQPATESPLVDKFGRVHRYLRVSVTDRCNFRCRYCMPTEGVEWRPREEILTLEEINRLVGIFAGLGIQKVRFTGGEPTLRKGIEDLIEHAANTPGVKSVQMTTNGTTLPKKAAEYRRRGLNGLNISLDTLDRAKFLELTGEDMFDRVMNGIDKALEVGFDTIKINVVAMAGFNDDELVDFVAMTKSMPVEVRFIEFMPFDNNGWEKNRLISYADMLKKIESRFELVKTETDKSAVGKEFSIAGHKGTVGFVTSMTENFCSGCDRVRLTSDGGIKSCLFFPPSSFVRDAMRSGADDGEIEQVIRDTILRKRKGHPDLSVLPQVKNAAMVSIGG